MRLLGQPLIVDISKALDRIPKGPAVSVPTALHAALEVLQSKADTLAARNNEVKAASDALDQARRLQADAAENLADARRVFTELLMTTYPTG